MRHYYFRLIFGIIWIIAAVVNIAIFNLPFAVLYIVLGVLFIHSAYSIRKKGEDSNEK